MKIAIIGNSHVGALRRAWNTISKNHPAKEITFFAGAGATLASLEQDGTSLVSKTPKTIKMLELTSGGKNRIDIPEYDTVLVYAMRSRPLFLENSVPVSQGFLKEYYKEKAFFQVLSKIRQITDKKLYLGHDPLLAKPLEEIEASLGVETDAHGQKIYDNAFNHMQNFVDELGGIEFIRQPKNTLVRNCATIMDYTKGSQRLRVDDNTTTKQRGDFHSDKDNTHMNNEYGEVYLDNFFKLVAA